MLIAYSRHTPHKVPALQEWIAIICVFLMIAGFMFSRALMSIGMIGIFLNIFWPQTLIHTFKSFLKFPFAWFCMAYFLMVFIGGVWSENQISWMQKMTLFLPMLTFPLGMLTLPIYKENFKKIFIAGLYTLILCAVGYSVYQFLLSPQEYISGYAHSKQIPTIKYNDHIRFSLLLALAVVPGYAFIESWLLRKSPVNGFKIFVLASIFIIMGYLHLLAAKTGLVCLYLVIMLILIDYMRKRGVSKLLLLSAPLLVLGIVVLGYVLIPTFALKIQYVLHEIELIRSGTALNYNYSSAGRLISYRIATEEIFQHPFFGVGTGDVMQHMRIGYQTYYPEIPAQNHLIPHSQYLYNLLAFGLVFFPILMSVIIAPFYMDRTPSKNFLAITSIVLIIAMTFEAMLQVQLGLFVYLFFTCIWYRWDRGPETILP